MISEEITRLQTAKADIKAALEEKGVEVSSSAKLDSYAGLIEDMSTDPGIVSTISEEDFSTSTHGTSFDVAKIIKSMKIPAGVTTVNRTWNMYELEYVEIPNTVTTLGDSVFGGCPKLKKVKFQPNSILTEIPAYFISHDLNTIGVVVENIPSEIVSVGRNSFHGTHLKQFPTWNDCTSIGSYAFRYCDFASVTIPPLVTTIEEVTFADCKNLETLDLSNTQDIKNTAFLGCSSLHNIIIPATVTNIDRSAFETGAQRTFTFLGTTPPTILDTKNALGFELSKITAIYVPAEAVDTYKNAGSGWWYYADKIQAIPTE